MSLTNAIKAISMTRLLSAVMVATALLLVTGSANAAAPGITGPNFDLTARAAFISQPDGAMIYSWGYGCNTTPTGFNPPASRMPGANCPNMQVPGPTLVVTEGQTVTVTLHNACRPRRETLRYCFPAFR